MTKILHDTSQFHQYADECVVTIGVFDGIHRGHQEIIGECVKEAVRRGIPSVVLTFDMHPKQIVSGDQPCVITDRARKIEIIRSLGVDYVIEMKFTRRFASLEPEEFCRQVLAEHLGARQVCIGENFHFGKGGRGDVDTLAVWGSRLGFGLDVIPLVKIGRRTISSTLTRGLISEGNVDKVGVVLGRPYSVIGKVVSGHSRGRGLGFPTANLGLERHFCIPAEGVYAGKALLGNGRYDCAINVGSNPTFGDTELALEVYMLDFDAEIYGETLEVEFHHRLRDEIAFRDRGELIRQMEKDVESARALLDADT